MRIPFLPAAARAANAARAARAVRLATLVACAALAAPAAPAHAAAQTIVRVADGRPLAPDGAVRLLVMHGSVRIVGWARDSVDVIGTRAADASWFIGGGRSGIKLGAEPLDKTSPAGAQLTVRVPAGARVAVRTTDAALDVSGLTGALDVSALGSDVRIAGSFTEITAETITGGITVTGSSAFMRLRTASGPIVARGAFDDATCSTVSGAVTLDSARVSHGRLETIAGDVRYTGSLPGGGSLDVDAHGGNVTVSLPISMATEFDVSAEDGALTVDPALGYVVMPLKSPPPLPAVATTAPRRDVSFVSGRGAVSARVTIRSFKGKVRLRALGATTR